MRRVLAGGLVALTVFALLWLYWPGSTLAQSVADTFRIYRVSTLGACDAANVGTLAKYKTTDGDVYLCTAAGWRSLTQDYANTFAALPDNNKGPVTGRVFQRFPAPGPCGTTLYASFTVTTPGTCVGACAALAPASQYSAITILSGTSLQCRIRIPCSSTYGVAVVGTCTGNATQPASDSTIQYDAADSFCTDNPAGIGYGVARVVACPGA